MDTCGECSSASVAPATEKEFPIYSKEINDENGVNNNKAVLVIGNDKVSLQDSFAKFRHQKIKERQLLQRCKQQVADGQRSMEYKSQLREKFINQAMKYLGVPYAERFKAPDAEVAPLYLDCCGLIRQAVKDLQEEFGFVIGKWNQCYQMDTLPAVLDFSALKPGDLIFYEGVYNSNRSKPQKHNNVHVEIFLGGETGEGTLGSRYHKGCVSLFPSYKFKSTTWDLVQYHYRSIDPWLHGECVSHCPEHQWMSDVLAIHAAAGRRSIFADDDDCSAGGLEQYDLADEEGGGDEESPTTAPVPSADSVDAMEAEIADLMIAAKEEIKVDPSDNSASENSSPESAPAASPVPSKKAPGGIAAPRARAPAATTPPRKATEDKPLLRPTPTASPSRSQRTKAADATPISTSTEGKPAAAVPSPSSSTSSLRRSQSTSLDVAPTATKATVSGKNKPPHTYFVCKSNGWKMVKAALDKRGWQQIPEEYQFSTRFSLRWVERRSQIDYKTHVPGQLVCHISNNEVITSKTGLLQALREAFVPDGGAPAPWLPETYLLDDPQDCVAALAIEETLSLANGGGRGAVWIYKPSSFNRGRGIRVFAGRDQLEEIVNGKMTGDPETSVPPAKGIVQRYIENPLLIKDVAGPERYKFDIRCYFLIARNSPTYLAFYHPGYCRLTLKPYSVSKESFEDPCVHLTNAAIQKKDPIYLKNKEFQIQTPQAVAALLDKDGKKESGKFLRSGLDDPIKRCLVDILTSGMPKLERRQGAFDLFGMDFMVDDSNKLVLIECNTNPSLSLDNSTLADMLPGVVEGALDLVLSAQGPDRPEDNDRFLGKALPSQWQLIFDENKGFAYGKK